MGVIAGRDKGKTGTVLRVLRKENAVLVEGINLVKKTIRGTEGQPGQIITRESPLAYSNVALLDPVSKKPTRVRWMFSSVDSRKVRVAVESGKEIPKPALLATRDPKYARPSQLSPKDTPLDVLRPTAAVGASSPVVSR